MPRVKTVNYGLQSLPCIDSKLRGSITHYMKQIESINEFKHVTKNWKLNLC